MKYPHLRLARTLLSVVLAISAAAPAALAEDGEDPVSLPPEDPPAETTEPPSIPPSMFPDVPEGHPAFTAIWWGLEQGIVQGYDDGTFQPSRTISRVEALKVIYLAQGPAPEGGEANFPDLASDAWYVPFIAKAQADGVVHGFPDGKFRPDQTVSRVELLKMTFRVHRANIYAAHAKPLFADTSLGRWYVPYVNLAMIHDLVDSPGTHFAPDRGMGREDVLVLLYRMTSAMASGSMQQLAPAVRDEHGALLLTASGTGVASYYHDSLAGNGTASGEPYDPTDHSCAHPSLPFGTIVTLTHAVSEKGTTCRVNDRGPFVVGRILDLSTAAFTDIAPLSSGLATVRWSATVPL